jgi:hypothetical protein
MMMMYDGWYAMADEYMDLCYKFWEGSWADDAVVWDRERRVAFEPEKVRYLDHQGVSGALSCFRGLCFADGDDRKILQDEGSLSDTSVSAADTGAFPGGNVQVWSGFRF